MKLFLILCILPIYNGFLFPTPKRSLFLDLPYKPVEGGRHTTCDVKSGNIPKEMYGKTCSRIGPNPKYEPSGGYHWFDGDGMTHSLNIDMEGKITYHNELVQTERLKFEQKHGGSIFFNIGDFFRPFALLKMLTLECFSKMGIIPDIPMINMSPANTNLVKHGEKILALCEAGLPYSMTYDKKFSTDGIEDFSGFIDGPLTGHPKTILSDNGYTYYFGTTGEIVKVYVFDQFGKSLRKFDISLESKSIMHDFAVSKNHILILDMPLVLNYKLLFKGRLPVEFDKTRKSRIGVLPIDASDGSTVKWYYLNDTFAISHVVNVYDNSTDGSINLITCDLKDVFLHPKELFKNRSEVYKTIIDMKNNRTTRTKLVEHEKSIDFPVISKYLTGVNNRYVYMTELTDGLPGNIIKIDIHSGEKLCSTDISEYSGECFFIEKDGIEDDGYIASFLTKGDNSEFCIWDAKDLSEVCRISIPYRIPLGFHTLVF